MAADVSRSRWGRRAASVAAAAGMALGAVVIAPAPAQAIAENSMTLFGAADWDRDGNQDLITRNDTSGDLWLFPGRSVRGPSGIAPVKIGNGWNGWSTFGVIDYDRDGYQDIVTRNNATQDIWLYPGRGVRGYSGIAPVRLWAGSPAWINGYTFIGAGDWDRNGYPDFMVMNPANGSLYMYEGFGHRAPETDQHLVWAGDPGTGWTTFGVTDWDRNGILDVILRWDGNGDLILFPGPGRQLASVGNGIKIGNGWNGTTSFGTADWDRDGHQDILVRFNSNRTLWVYPGQSVRGYSNQTPVQISTGF